MQIPGMSSIGTQPVFPAAQQPVAPARPSGEGGGFADVVRSAIEAVDAQQGHAAGGIQDLLAGKSTDVLPVVAEVAEADMSFKLLMAVRNKVIEAYKQTMNMQV